MSASTTDSDPVLTRERDHLIRSRESLAAMRAGGQHRRRRRRRRLLQRVAGRRPGPPAQGAGRRPGRAAVLRPDRPQPRTASARTGRASTSAAGTSATRLGDPLVIDWRAPMSRSFYRATPAEPMGVRRRRRFGFAAGTLTSYEDEPLTAGADVAAPSRAGSCWRRSSGPGSARCGTSSRPSSRTRTTWSGPSWTTASACRARPAPARPRSACTGRRTCSTPTRSGCAGPACWSSARTGRSCATSARCCRRSARSGSARPRWTTCSRRSRSGPWTRPSWRRSRATRGWPRCCAGRCSGRSASRSRAWS